MKIKRLQIFCYKYMITWTCLSWCWEIAKQDFLSMFWHFSTLWQRGIKLQLKLKKHLKPHEKASFLISTLVNKCPLEWTFGQADQKLNRGSTLNWSITICNISSLIPMYLWCHWFKLLQVAGLLGSDLYIMWSEYWEKVFAVSFGSPD